MPRNKPAFRRILWNEDFLERYARAREAQADKYFQEIIEIADAATPETVNVARLRVDSRKFTVARLAPKKYGDHISHNVNGPGPTSSRRSLSPWMVSRTTSLLDSLHTTKTVGSYSTATEILCKRAEPEFPFRIWPGVRPLVMTTG